ncbi:hypothetical protein ACF0H5_016173 [Mactra antiquata]
MIEGAWKHAKDYFKRMNGVRGFKTFEIHLMYQTLCRDDNLPGCFINDVRHMYILHEPPNYTYLKPIFQTMPRGEDYMKVTDEVDVAVGRMVDNDDSNIAVGTMIETEKDDENNGINQPTPSTSSGASRSVK